MAMLCQNLLMKATITYSLNQKTAEHSAKVLEWSTEVRQVIEQRTAVKMISNERLAYISV